MGFRGLLSAVIVSIGVGALSAPASAASDWDLCKDENIAAQPSIEACTRAIRSQKYKGADLSILYYNRGVSYRQLNDNDAAVADYSESIRLNTKYEKPYNNRANIWKDKGDTARALADYTAAIRIKPDYATALANRADIYDDQNELDKALADLNIALKSEPNYARAYNLRGLVKRKKDDVDGAISDFNEAIRSDKNYHWAYNNRALAYEKKKDIDRAIADYSEAIRVKPDYTVAMINRADLLDDKGLLDQAIADLDRALSIDGRSARGFNLRGLIYKKKDMPDRAIADFDASTRIDAKYIYPYNNRAQVYEKKGDLDRALSDFRVALSIDPKSNTATEGIKRVEGAIRTAGRTVPQNLPPNSNNSPVNPSNNTNIATLPPKTNIVPPPSNTNTQQLGNVSREPRVALVIGNGRYENASPLPNPANDARALSATLKQLGFDVLEGTDLDRSSMERLIRDFMRKATQAKVALVFYAGHGMQVDGKNYLVPIDAKLQAPSDLAFETVEVDKMLDALNDPTRTSIVILDACRDNPLARSFASRLPPTRSAAAGSGLAAYTAVGTGTLIAYATAPGQVALDGHGANSPFTQALIKHIRTPNIEVQQMLTRVRIEVAQTTGNKQIPWANSSLMGEVFLGR